MKSLTSPENTGTPMLHTQGAKPSHGNMIALYNLYQQVEHLDGVVVNCGISSEENFASFAMLRNMMKPKKLVAFEKHAKNMFFNRLPEPHGTLYYKTVAEQLNTGLIQLNLQKQHIRLQNEFVPGYLTDAVPNYLMENPELKISFLTLQLDDYESAITALEFFYPRLEHGGVLVIENYNKADEDYRAVCDYFAYDSVEILSLSQNGPHFVIKK